MIVGVDLSTTRLDFAFVATDGQWSRVEFTHARMIVVPKGACEAHRAREAHQTTRRLLDGRPLTAVVVERPIGHSDAILSVIFGAVAAAVPYGVELAEMKAVEWRKTLGLPVRRPTGAPKTFVKERTIEYVRERVLWEPDEHEADAVGIALAWLATRSETGTILPQVKGDA